MKAGKADSDGACLYFARTRIFRKKLEGVGSLCATLMLHFINPIRNSLYHLASSLGR